MISSHAEIDQANALLEEYKNELRAENIPFDEHIEVGAMVEIPSAAIAADMLASRVKFFSIGTNDLIQYSLAVDRLNERIAHLYEPTHPAVLRLIKWTAEAAVRHGLWCGVCGEMAGDLSMTPLLIGLGIRELSMAAPLLPRVKFLIRRLKMQDTVELANFALNCESGRDILRRSQALAEQTAPSLFEKQE
jgi:phosphotransferase system enzyme I (PtsI)